MSSHGLFVTFEGGEGAGKSTVVAGAAEALRDEGFAVLVTREPGAGAFGAAVRSLLLDQGDVTDRSELFLFLADRAHHCRQIIAPALTRGEIVLCDRHADSTLVYQGMVRGLDETFVRSANTFATEGLTPDRTLLLDVPAEIGLARVRKRPHAVSGLASGSHSHSVSGPRNRLDQEPLEFHRRVRAGFLRLADDEPTRWRVIDATQDFPTVLACALAEIRPS